MLQCFTKGPQFIGEVNVKDQKVISKEIDKIMKREKRKFMTRHNILLLGTGESGKSTFLKQMKIINGKRFTSEELASFKDIIYDNIYKGILFLLDARENSQINWEGGSEHIDAADRIEQYYRKHRNEHRDRISAGQLVWTEEEFLLLVGDINVIWSDKAIKDTFSGRFKMLTENFSENTRYYLNKMDKIGVKDYYPSNEDIVWSRKPTTAIIEEEIEIRGSCIVFIDVGGQTKERRKWYRMFEDMNSVLFLIAYSHFDERYYDKTSREQRNKLREAMRVFQDLINMKYFLTTSVILLFNKTDILTEKLDNRTSDIRTEFPEFPTEYDPYSLAHVQKFVLDTLVSYVDRSPGSAGQAKTRNIYKNYTTAVDRHNIETVFDAMKDTILQKNIDQLVMK